MATLRLARPGPALPGLAARVLRSVDDLNAAILRGERIFGVLQVLGAHTCGHQPPRVDAEVGDQILAHSLGPLLGQCQVVVGAALAVTVPGNEKGVAGEAVIAQCAAEWRK